MNITGNILTILLLLSALLPVHAEQHLYRVTIRNALTLPLPPDNHLFGSGYRIAVHGDRLWELFPLLCSGVETAYRLFPVENRDSEARGVLYADWIDASLQTYTEDAWDILIGWNIKK